MPATSQDIDALTNALIEEAVNLGRRIEVASAAVLMEQRVKIDDFPRLSLLTMVRRMHPFFQAVLRLTERGLHDPAAAVLRTLMELAYVSRAINNEPGALDLLKKQSDGEMRKALGGLSRLSPGILPPEMSGAALEKAMAQLLEHGGFNAFDWAAKSGLSDSYLTLYRRLCAYSHGSLLPLADYVHPVPDSEKFTLGDSNVRHDMPGYLTAACSLMLDAAQMLVGWAATDAQKTEMDAIHEQLNALATRTYEHDELKASVPSPYGPEFAWPTSTDSA